MAKKAPKAAPAADPNAPPKKRSKLKLILLILAPLVLLGGGGYAGWTFFLAAPPEEHAEANPHGIDPHKVAALKAESAPETTFTYALALSEFLKKDCGGVKLTALKEASEAEAHADGVLAHKSWLAAARRFESVTEASCDRMRSEIYRAEDRAVAGASAASGDGHAEKPAAH